jgi:hypothetical protein
MAHLRQLRPAALSRKGRGQEEGAGFESFSALPWKKGNEVASLNFYHQYL